MVKLEDIIKKIDIKSLRVEKIMTKNPISINKDDLAAKALALMNEKNNFFVCL